MRVLVTGHLGYIGTCLVPRLVSAGYEVVGCDTDLFRGCSFGDLPAQVPNLGSDIRDLEARQLEGFDAIMHLAGLSNDPLGELDPRLTHEINCLATVNLARRARESGVSCFVYSSSCSSYGAAGEEFVDEDATMNPVTAYGRSKVDAERGLARLAGRDFTPVYLRHATVYGHTPRIRFDLVVNNLVAWAHTTGRVFLKSRGLAWRPLVHVEDVADAFLACLRSPRENIHDQAFNIGRSDENYRVSELAEMVASEMPGTVVEMAEGAQADKRTYRVNCDKALATLTGWQPSWTVSAGIRSLAEIYRHYGLNLDEFEGSRYQRVAHLKERLASGDIDSGLRHREPPANTGGHALA